MELRASIMCTVETVFFLGTTASCCFFGDFCFIVALFPSTVECISVVCRVIPTRLSKSRHIFLNEKLWDFKDKHSVESARTLQFRKGYAKRWKAFETVEIERRNALYLSAEI